MNETRKVAESSTASINGRVHRLENLLGISQSDASDISLAGRLKTISRLRAARLAEIKRGHGKSWLYDVNRHLAICSALRTEYEALADSLDAVDAMIWRKTSPRNPAQTGQALAGNTNYD